MPRKAKHSAPGDGHADAHRAGQADPHAVLHPDAKVGVHQLTAGRVRAHGGAEQRPPVMRDGALDASRIPSGGWLSRATEPKAAPVLIYSSGDQHAISADPDRRFWPVDLASPSQPQPARQRR